MRWNLPKRPTRRKRIYCIFVFALFSVTFIIAGILVGWSLRVKNFSSAADTNATFTNTMASRTVYLGAELISADPVASNMAMNWYIEDDDCLDPNCTPVKIFFDTNLLVISGDDKDKNLTNWVAPFPIFTWYPEANENSNSTNAIFRTTSLLIQNRNKAADPSLQSYPFDVYHTLFVVYGVDDTTGKYVNIFVDYSTGVAVGFETSSSNTTDRIAYNPLFYVNEISLRRNSLIKAYVMCIVIGVWLITITFVASVMKVLFGYKQPKEALVVPIATLFAVTTLRGTMPGAPPGFGAIMDFVGILPCLAIITIAGVILFGFLVMSPGEGKATEPSSSMPRPLPHNMVIDVEAAQFTGDLSQTAIDTSIHSLQYGYEPKSTPRPSDGERSSSRLHLNETQHDPQTFPRTHFYNLTSTSYSSGLQVQQNQEPSRTPTSGGSSQSTTALLSLPQDLSFEPFVNDEEESSLSQDQRPQSQLINTGKKGSLPALPQETGPALNLSQNREVDGQQTNVGGNGSLSAIPESDVPAITLSQIQFGQASVGSSPLR